VKTIAVLNADLVQSPLATPSRLAREMNGVPILAQTVSRVLKIHSVEGVYVLCPTDQRDRCARILTGMNVTVCQHDAGPPPWATLVRTARKWSLDAWRGGIGGATCFDEYTDARLIAGLLETTSADAVLSLPPAAMLFDPALGEKIIAHRKKISDEAKMSFVQAPPGLTAILLDSDVVGELAEKRLPVGTIFGYKPQAPQKDMIFEPCCCPTPADLRFATGRLIADTDRAVERISRILSSGCSADAETMGRHLIERDERGSEPFPYEVEIELTTDDPYPANLLRPRGKKVPPRGPIPVDCICKVADELAERDDALCVLAGFGDPLRHPQLPAILDALRPAPGGGVYGLAVVTAGVDLTDNVINLLISHRVDVVSVTLDAWTPETYQALQSPGGETSARLDVVLEKLDRLASLRADRRSVAPLVVPTFCKSRENLHEMDAFMMVGCNDWGSCRSPGLIIMVIESPIEV